MQKGEKGLQSVSIMQDLNIFFFLCGLLLLLYFTLGSSGGSN